METVYNVSQSRVFLSYFGCSQIGDETSFFAGRQILFFDLYFLNHFHPKRIFFIQMHKFSSRYGECLKVMKTLRFFFQNFTNIVLNSHFWKNKLQFGNKSLKKGAGANHSIVQSIRKKYVQLQRGKYWGTSAWTSPEVSLTSADANTRMKIDENRRNFLAGCPNEESLDEIMDDKYG